MIARVIVDVPTAQTDRLFDYEVPHEWRAFARPGARVIVPFGPRRIQGFVVALEQTSEATKLKPISEVLDPLPVLSEELLELGDWLAKTTVCYKVKAFSAMLPAALKTKVSKQVERKAALDLLPLPLQTLFADHDVVPWEVARSLMKQDLSLLKTALDEGVVSLVYKVTEKGAKKTARLVQALPKQVEDIPERAKKQRELFCYLQENGPIPTKDALQQSKTTRATLKALIEKGFAKETDVEVYRDPLQHEQIPPSAPLELTPAQAAVIAPIEAAIENGHHEAMLLHGVTGSGKTEIYLQAIAKVLEKGKEAMMLVPEISLTPQMVTRFKARFGDLVAIMHSGLSSGEKYDEWRKIYRKEVKVVVGARSAVFAPFTNIGLIIIDEEHEASYKQEETPRYHAKDVALYRGRKHKAPVLLGSATPSVESFARAKKGVYRLLSLRERIKGRPLPEVDVVDMREELRRGNRSMFSGQLLQALQARLERNEQSVLFLNRRGYSTFVMCRDCGYVASCSHCDISYTYHRAGNSLKCHYCGDEQPMPKTCAECGSDHIRFFGSGTQKVEEELARLLPEAKVIRMDVDTTRKKGAHKQLLEAFGKGDADILLGTQMIAKGLDFPRITLVGVLTADTMLHIPDFRSAERTFQLLEQVAGRAGRDQLKGEVIIQSYTPDHYSIQLVKSHDYEQFFAKEMQLRKQGSYPPYYYMALLTISDTELASTISAAQKVARYLKESLNEETVVLGPVVSPIARIKDRYRYQCVIKYRHEPKLQEILDTVMRHYLRDATNKKLQISIDVNPHFFM
ncbi:primosome assembly protein PriA [Niallia circulans]|uniref:primosomal protein N' n=1 Tax=Shouchella clausii TaxID=79880 RepID=UPI000D882A1C|nr:primosomal protein N' [Shouchella clausii]SPU22107.1 primosome assembly protein PriA [Niallia circulans]